MEREDDAKPASNTTARGIHFEHKVHVVFCLEHIQEVDNITALIAHTQDGYLERYVLWL